VVPAGGLSVDHTRWIKPRYDFFLPVEVLSRVFRGKFHEALKRAFHDGKLNFHGDLKLLAQPKTFAAWLRPLFRNDWVVYSKRPFGGPEHVLRYLGRYTHRVAISNHRLVSFADGKVTFRWRDSAHSNEQKLLTLSLDEFLPKAPINATLASATKPAAAYIPAYPVVDALNFSAALQRVGDRVELIGRIVEIKPGSRKQGKGRSKRYVFINFGSWRGNIVKISIWSDGLARLKEQPSAKWIGRWVSVTGLMDVPYETKLYKHLSITVQEEGQIQWLDDAQAGFRLASIAMAPPPRDRGLTGAVSSASPVPRRRPLLRSRRPSGPAVRVPRAATSALARNRRFRLQPSRSPLNKGSNRQGASWPRFLNGCGRSGPSSL